MGVHERKLNDRKSVNSSYLAKAGAAQPDVNRRAGRHESETNLKVDGRARFAGVA